MARITKKRAGFGLQITTLKGGKGNYIFVRTHAGSYHAFLEVAAVEAAKDCGAKGKGQARQLCKQACRF